jgi:hypothetical protein
MLGPYPTEFAQRPDILRMSNPTVKFSLEVVSGTTSRRYDYVLSASNATQK